MLGSPFVALDTGHQVGMSQRRKVLQDCQSCTICTHTCLQTLRCLNGCNLETLPGEVSSKCEQWAFHSCCSSPCHNTGC